MKIEKERLEIGTLKHNLNKNYNKIHIQKNIGESKTKINNWNKHSKSNYEIFIVIFIYLFINKIINLLQ